jgi:hypothetical protein
MSSELGIVSSEFKIKALVTKAAIAQSFAQDFIVSGNVAKALRFCLCLFSWLKQTEIQQEAN